MAQNDQANNFLIILQNERGFSYLQTCLQDLPCIDWLDFVAKMYRRNKKATTALLCCRAMCYLNEFYKGSKHEGTLCDELKAIIATQDSKKALQLIDDFVGYCDLVRGIKAGSIRVHVKAIKRVFKYTGVKIDKDDFNDKVIMPKAAQPIEEYPANEQIIRIANFLTPRKRGALFTINDSGLGRAEAIRLRPKDFHFNEDPVRIETNRFKTGEYVETFCSAETANTVKRLIENYNIKPDQYIFAKKIGKNAEDKLTGAYVEALKKAGLDQKLEVRIGNEVKEHAYYKFHIHIYRKRWFTKAINVVPAYVAHAMLGRKQYLDQYLAHPLSERQAFYKKIIKHVGLFESKQDKAEIAEQVAKTLGLQNVDPAQIEQLAGIFGNFATKWRELPQEQRDLFSKIFGGASA